MTCVLLTRFSTLTFLGFLIGCSQTESPVSNSQPAPDPQVIVAVTSQVLLDLAQEIGGDSFEVIKPVSDNISSRHWEPTGDDVRLIQKAKLVLFSGAGYEPWKDRVSLPGSRVRDTAVGYYSQFIRIPDAISHQHGPEGKHSHPGTVWATWLDPELAVSQLQQVTNALVKVAPERKIALETAAAKMKAQLDALNPLIEEIKAIPQPEDLLVISDGPFYQYLTTRLGFSLSYMHWDDSATDLTEINRNELTEMLAKSPAPARRIFLMNTQRSASIEEFVASTELTIVRIDLCETPAIPAAPLVDRLRGNLERLKAGVQKNL